MKSNTAFTGASSFDRSMRAVLKKCDEVVLFGSRSSTLHRSDSDWDVLCVAKRPPAILDRVPRPRLRLKLGLIHLDLIWISTDALTSATWLGSELASHVATYGRWLMGSGDWRTRTAISSLAVAAKQRRVEVRISFQRQYGSGLLAPYLAKHLTLLRRDIQRLYCLENRIPVPTTPHIDAEWCESRDREGILRFARSLGVDLEGLQ